jgi:acyl-CoA synthetase (AMP-forming)/AMP-acid ligase II
MANSLTTLVDDEVESSDVSVVFRSTFPPRRRGAEDFRRRAWTQGLPEAGEELRTYHRTILHALAASAKAGDSVGITLLPDEESGEQQFKSYEALYLESLSLASVLVNQGIRRGDRVLLLMPTCFEFLLSFFAIQMAGAIPVPAYPPALLEKAETALDRLRHVANHCGARACISVKLLMPLVGGLAFKCKNLEHIWSAESLLAQKSSRSLKVQVHGRDPGFFQYTSGSTGHPKGVMLSHRNLVANIHAAGQAANIIPDERLVSWLPLCHNMGLIATALMAVYWCVPLALMSPLAFLVRPARWLTAITQFKGTFSAAPNFAYGVCVKRVRRSEREGLDLSSWRLALTGAEPVSMRTVNDFTEAFKPYGFRSKAFYPGYGLAEATVAVTMPKPGEGVVHESVDRAALAQGRVVVREGPGSSEFVSVGHPVPGHELLIVNDAVEPVPPRTVGHILIRGPSLMQGYYQDLEATSAVLREGWLWTGDLGYQTKDGLFITGRAKDLIIVRGKNFYAEDLERVAERIEGVLKSGVAAFGVYDEERATDITVVVCETKLRAEAKRQRLVERVGEAITESCGLKVDEVVPVLPDTIPRTASGKRQRNLCRELYLKGELRPKKTGKLKLGWVFVRSGAGYVSLFTRRILKGRRAPD